MSGRREAALSDVNRASAEAVKADLAPDATVFDTGEELISSDQVDAVLVTSWGATHEQYVLAAIAAGLEAMDVSAALATAACGTRVASADWKPATRTRPVRRRRLLPVRSAWRVKKAARFLLLPLWSR